MAKKKTDSNWQYTRNNSVRVMTAKITGTNKNEKVIQYLNKDGKWRNLFNPSQRGRKYAKEIKEKKDVFTGKPLTNTQLAHRSGYLKARSDNAKAYNARKAKRTAAKEAKKF